MKKTSTEMLTILNLLFFFIYRGTTDYYFHPSCFRGSRRDLRNILFGGPAPSKFNGVLLFYGAFTRGNGKISEEKYYVENWWSYYFTKREFHFYLDIDIFLVCKN